MGHIFANYTGATCICFISTYFTLRDFMSAGCMGFILELGT